MKNLVPALSCLVLAACGGGGSTVTPPTPPTATPNVAPVIAVPTAETVVPENTAGTVLTVDASDADGDGLSYALTAGDTAAFAIDASGALSFVEAPDFEQPTDSDADNTYTVTVEVSDGRGGAATQDYTVRVTDEAFPESGLYETVQFTGARVATGLEFAPGLFADVYAPQGRDDDGERPVIILASGGGFIVQGRRTVEPIALDFASRGWLAVTVDYRVLGRFPRDEAEIQVAAARATHDMFGAVRAARSSTGFLASYNFDRDLVFTGGESAGAFMAILTATLDPDDTIDSTAISDYLAANGGAYGNVGDHDTEDSVPSGALALSGALFDTGLVDADSRPTYFAHEEDDTTVPCDTDREGATGVGTTVSGSCVLGPVFVEQGLPTGSLIIENDAGHVDFTMAERETIYTAATELFVDSVLRD